MIKKIYIIKKTIIYLIFIVLFIIILYGSYGVFNYFCYKKTIVKNISIQQECFKNTYNLVDDKQTLVKNVGNIGGWIIMNDSMYGSDDNNGYFYIDLNSSSNTKKVVYFKNRQSFLNFLNKKNLFYNMDFETNIADLKFSSSPN